MKRFLCLIYLILCCHFGACEEVEVNCEGVQGNKQNLPFVLYYDAGTDMADQDTTDLVLAQLCPNKQLIDFEGRVTISLKPGAFVLEVGGILDCYNSFNHACTMPLIHACARSFLSDEKFIQFVCCSVYQPAKATIQCAVNLGIEEKKINDCVYDVNSKDHSAAKSILIGNTKELGSKVINIVIDVYPAPLYDSWYGRCWALQSRYFLIHTMCKLLADPKPQLCKH